MNQKLSDWASIAEVVSSIAVVVTLVFLVLGIRENTEVTRAGAYDRYVDGMNQWRFELARNAELAELYFPREDETIDEWRRGLMLVSIFNIFENSFYSNQYGVLGEDEWRRIEAEVCRVQNIWEHAQQWELAEFYLTEDFAAHIASTCRNGDVIDSSSVE